MCVDHYEDPTEQRETRTTRHSIVFNVSLRRSGGTTAPVRFCSCFNIKCSSRCVATGHQHRTLLSAMCLFLCSCLCSETCSEDVASHPHLVLPSLISQHLSLLLAHASVAGTLRFALSIVCCTCDVFFVALFTLFAYCT